MSDPTLASIEVRPDADADGRDDEWSLVVAGDTVVETPTAPAVGDDLADAVAAADLSLANLEAPVASDADPIEKVGPTNETAVETPRHLRAIGFDALTLANNHVMDHGSAGLERTLAACADAGVDTCGAGASPAEAGAPLTRTIRGQSVAVVSLCEREFGAAEAGRPGTAWVGAPGVHRRVREAVETNDVVVVAVHGGVEYVPLPPPQFQARLRSFAAAGADLVVGHHPHVPQGYERHEGTPICYSLGNFRYTRCCRPKTEWGLVLSATVAGDRLTRVALHPVERRGDAVAFMGERWDPAEFAPYLDTAATVVRDRERLRAHWQELSARVFEQRYTRWVRAAAGSDLGTLATTPWRYLDDDALFDPDDRSQQLLLLLNLVRNESHRAVIETATALATGRAEDRRTPAVRSRVRELLDVTEDEPVYDRPSTAETALRAVAERASDRLPGAGD